MACMPRLYMPGCAQHIIQRGNNRSVCFCCDATLHHHRDFWPTECYSMPVSLLDRVRLCTNKEWFVGGSDFVKQIEAAIGRKVYLRQWGGSWRSRKDVQELRPFDPAAIPLKLPANDRAALVETLIFSLDKPDASIDAEWLRVAEDRLADYHAEELEAVDAADVFAELGKKFWK